MIHENRKKIRLSLLITFILAVAAGIFRTFLLRNYIEPETGFYVKGTSLGTVFGVVTFVLLAVSLSAGFFMRKLKAPENLDSRSTAVVFSSALCAFVYLSVAVWGLYSAFADGKAGLFLTLELILCIPCIINHVAICASEVRKKNSWHAIVSMAAPLFFAVRVVEVFMNTGAQINISQRSLELLMLCAAMIFMLKESSMLITGELSAKNISGYLASGLALIAMTIITVVPHLALSVFWVFENEFAVMDILECSAAIYAVSRILTLHD